MNLEKIKKFFTNQYFIITLITILAFLVRLLNLDKASGLWLDEMMTYLHSNKDFPLGIIKMAYNYDFHMPLYYLTINIWMKVFGSSDIVLRLYSVLWGVLTIPALFFLGKTYRSKNLGYFLSAFAALSPILIYYSQEFRFYSMDIFWTTVSLIFFLRLLEQFNKKDFIWLSFANLMILYIDTTGILFVAIELFLLFAHFYKTENLKSLVKYSSLFFIFTIPYLFLFFSYMIATKNSMINPFSFSETSISTFFYLLNDWFSPLLTCIYKSKVGAYNVFFKNPLLIFAFLFFIAPSICFLIGLILEIKKFNRKVLYLLSLSFGLVFIKFLLTFSGNMILITRYTLICLPALFLMGADGILLIKSKRTKFIYISIIFVIFGLNCINYKNMPTFAQRADGYNFLTKSLEDLKLSKTDFILYPWNSILLDKYIKNVSYIDFDFLGIVNLDKSKSRAYKAFDANFVSSTVEKNSAEKFMPFLLRSTPTIQMKKYTNSMLKQIPNGGRFIFIEDCDDKIYTNSQLKMLMANKRYIKEEYNMKVLYLVYNKFINDFENSFDADKTLSLKNILIVRNITPKAYWKIYVYQKIN